MSSGRPVKIIITLAALLAAVVHVLVPTVTVDAVTLALLVLAAVPWLGPLLKSVELPGGIKLEMRDLERIELRAEQAGLLSEVAELPRAETTAPEYSFRPIQAQETEHVNRIWASFRDEHGIAARRD